MPDITQDYFNKSDNCSFSLYNFNMAEGISLSQAEIDKVLNSVKQDQAENEERVSSAGVALSQTDLDRLFAKKSDSSPAEENLAESTKEEKASDSTSGTVVQEETPSPNKDDEAARRAAKIAERQKRTADLLAKVNAASPKRISVEYGKATLMQTDIDKFEIGSRIPLVRDKGSLCDIFCDGRLIGRGVIEKHKGQATVVISQILQ